MLAASPRPVGERPFPFRLIASLAMWLALSNTSWADRPSWASVEAVVDAHFAATDTQAHDVIARSDIQPLLDELHQLGVPAGTLKSIYESTLPDGDFLVVQLRTDAGRRFMRKLSTQKLFYDQLDRIAQQSGGKALIRHLIRLPDGEQFVRSGRAATVPGLVELLPKQGSSKSRRVRDFDSPTGKIYTAEQLKQRLQETMQQNSKSAKTTAE